MLMRTIKNIGLVAVIGTVSGVTATVLVLGVHKIVKKIRNK